MGIAALVTSAVLMLLGQVENVTYKVCMYNVLRFAGMDIPMPKEQSVRDSD